MRSVRIKVRHLKSFLYYDLALVVVLESTMGVILGKMLSVVDEVIIVLVCGTATLYNRTLGA
jgi:hypothetical protein